MRPFTEVQPGACIPSGCVGSRTIQCVSGGAEGVVSLEHVLGERASVNPNKK